MSDKDKKEKSLEESEFLHILWEYFSLHASQRIQMLNFYIILETFLLTAWLTLLQIDEKFNVPRIIIGVAIIIFSIVFYALDIRTKSMIKLCEESLCKVESSYVSQFGKKYMVFNLEQESTGKERKKNWFKRHFLSYSKLLLIIYSFFGLVGVLAIVMELLK